MSRIKCCVQNCNKTRTDNTSLHLFPNPDKDLERFLQWTTAIGGDVLFMDNNTVYKEYRVCHSHFELKYHTRSRRLSANAIPTLFLSGLYSFRRLHMQEITNQNYSQRTYGSSRQPIASTSATPTQYDVLIESSGQQLTSTSSQHLTTEQETVSTTMQQPSPHSDGGHKRSYISSEVVALRHKINRLQKSKDLVLTRLKKALKLSENETFKKMLKKFTSTAKIFTMLQFREAGKHKLGRRFTKNEKVMCLALYKQGPKAYRWLRKFFVLPSTLTLIRMITRAGLKPGINNKIFNQ